MIDGGDFGSREVSDTGVSHAHAMEPSGLGTAGPTPSLPGGVSAIHVSIAGRYTTGSAARGDTPGLCARG